MRTVTRGGVEPPGQAVTFCGVNFLRLRDRKVIEIWSHRDDLGLLQQTGGALYAGAAPEQPE